VGLASEELEAYLVRLARTRSPSASRTDLPSFLFAARGALIVSCPAGYLIQITLSESVLTSCGEYRPEVFRRRCPQCPVPRTGLADSIWGLAGVLGGRKGRSSVLAGHHKQGVGHKKVSGLGRSKSAADAKRSQISCLLH